MNSLTGLVATAAAAMETPKDVGGQLVIGGETTVIGLAVVFVLLAVLIAIIILVGKAVIPILKVSEWKANRSAAKAAAKEEKKNQKKLAKMEKPEPATKAADIEAIEESNSAMTVEAQPTDDTELVAVLTAAVAASMGTSAGKVKIASYKKTNRRSAWARAGRNEQLARF